MWTLVRFAYLPDGTLGELTIPGQPKIFTIERPWRNNEARVSCIPEGEYPLRPHIGRIQPAILIDDVPGRSAILFHVGNTQADLMGCIAPGLWWRTDPPTALNSKAAMVKLMESFAAQGHQGRLVVRTLRAQI